MCNRLEHLYVSAELRLQHGGKAATSERYIAARHGGAPHYAHPHLEDVLSDTYGVTIWHEQIIETLDVMTGCGRPKAEIARRALIDKAELPRIKGWFHHLAAARGYSSAVRDEVWATIEAFGAYGFCRAHAVAFAVPALQSAWLKAHFPAFLLAGLLEHDPGMWPKRVIVSDARRRGIPVLPVDVNRSKVEHTVERVDGDGWGVRLALAGVHGINEDEGTRIVAGQPYRSLSDFWQRARPSRPLAERLAGIGALDALHDGRLTRRDLLLQLTDLHRQSRVRTAGKGQLPIEAGAIGGTESSGLPEMTGREALGAELDTLGIDVSRPLMEHHHRLLREIGATDAAHLAGFQAGRQVLVAGVRASTQTPPIASGKRIIFVTLEDGSGLVDLAFFEDSHENCAHTVFHSGLLLVRGTVQVRGTRRTVVGTMAWDLDKIATARRDDGPEAALAMLGATHPQPTPAQPYRTLPNGTAGAQLHPYADLQPAGTRTADLKKLGHRSSGSAG